MSISSLTDPAVRNLLGVGSRQIGGLASGLTWQVSGGLYTSSIEVYECSTSSIITATIQNGTESDVINCWLAKAVPQTGSIHFYVAGNPATPSSFAISWQITNAYNPSS